jgi:hypothetical protein
VLQQGVKRERDDAVTTPTEPDKVARTLSSSSPSPPALAADESNRVRIVPFDANVTYWMFTVMAEDDANSMTMLLNIESVPDAHDLAIMTHYIEHERSSVLADLDDALLNPVMCGAWSEEPPDGIIRKIAKSVFVPWM